jgi:chloramphenicol-sensitive protein RarD
VATDSDDSTTPATGAWAAIGAFGLWGVLPLYWKQLEGIAATELIAHRVVWSLVLLMVLVRMRGRGPQFRAAVRDGRTVGLYALSAALIGGNWLLFVWAVNSGQILESSLGYFLNPLFNVALGFFLLRERLRPLQWTAVAFAASGVLVQLIQLGRLPWVALGLASSFALYGLLRKRGPLGPVAGLGLETLLLAPLAAGYLVWRIAAGESALGHVDAMQHTWMLSAGVVTTVPLLLFATAARAMPLSLLGLFQYLAPTGQFLLGVLLYHEAFGRAQAMSFALIWLGLAVFTVDGLRRRLPEPPPA